MTTSQLRWSVTKRTPSFIVIRCIHLTNDWNRKERWTSKYLYNGTSFDLLVMGRGGETVQFSDPSVRVWYRKRKKKSGRKSDGVNTATRQGGNCSMIIR